jgi:hypothetical protein
MSQLQVIDSGKGVSIIKDRQQVFNALQYEDPNSVTFYDFEHDTIVRGSNPENYLLPDTKDVVCNMREYFDQKDRYDKKQISFDQFVTRPFKREYQDDAYKLFLAIHELKHKDNNLLEASNVNSVLEEINVRDNIFEAAEINADMFATLKTTAVQQVLIAQDQQSRFLDSLVTTVTSNTLNDYEIMIWGENDKMVTRDIGLDGVPTGILPPKYTTRKFGNQLNGTLVTFNGNVALTAFDVDIQSPITRMMQGAIEADKQDMLMELLNGTGIFETAIATDWDMLQTNGRSAARAHEDIEAQIQDIADEHLGSDIGLLSNRAVRNLYDENQAGWGMNIALGGNLVTQGNVELKRNRVDTNAPRLAGYPWVIDEKATTNTLTLVEKKAIYMNQGPRRVSSITHPIIRSYGNVVLEFYKATLLFPELARRLTSMT